MNNLYKTSVQEFTPRIYILKNGEMVITPDFESGTASSSLAFSDSVIIYEVSSNC